MLIECPVCKRVQDNMVGRPIRCLWCGQMLDPSSECRNVQFAEPEHPRVKLEKAPRVNLRKEVPVSEAEVEIGMRKARLAEAIAKTAAAERRFPVNAPPVAVRYENIPQSRLNVVIRSLLDAAIIPGLFLLSALSGFLSESELDILGGLLFGLCVLLVPMSALPIPDIQELLNRKFPDMSPLCLAAVTIPLFFILGVLGFLALVNGYSFGITLWNGVSGTPM